MYMTYTVELSTYDILKNKILANTFILNFGINKYVFTSIIFKISVVHYDTVYK